jgi:hypothetical protein
MNVYPSIHIEPPRMRIVLLELAADHVTEKSRSSVPVVSMVTGVDASPLPAVVRSHEASVAPDPDLATHADIPLIVPETPVVTTPKIDLSRYHSLPDTDDAIAAVVAVARTEPPILSLRIRVGLLAVVPIEPQS